WAAPPPAARSLRRGPGSTAGPGSPPRAKSRAHRELQGPPCSEWARGWPAKTTTPAPGGARASRVLRNGRSLEAALERRRDEDVAAVALRIVLVRVGGDRRAVGADAVLPVGGRGVAAVEGGVADLGDVLLPALDVRGPLRVAARRAGGGRALIEGVHQTAEVRAVDPDRALGQLAGVVRVTHRLALGGATGDQKKRPEEGGREHELQFFLLPEKARQKRGAQCAASRLGVNLFVSFSTVEALAEPGLPESPVKRRRDATGTCHSPACPARRSTRGSSCPGRRCRRAGR